jgi:hypothetical protein
MYVPLGETHMRSFNPSLGCSCQFSVPYWTLLLLSNTVTKRLCLCFSKIYGTVRNSARLLYGRLEQHVYVHLELLEDCAKETAKQILLGLHWLYEGEVNIVPFWIVVGASAKLRNASISFVMSVRPSVRMK